MAGCVAWRRVSATTSTCRSSNRYNCCHTCCDSNDGRRAKACRSPCSGSSCTGCSPRRSLCAGSGSACTASRWRLLLGLSAYENRDKDQSEYHKQNGHHRGRSSFHYVSPCPRLLKKNKEVSKKYSQTDLATQ
jgi:hypothetical protein